MPERVALEAHLEGCPGCSEEVASRWPASPRCCRWRTRQRLGSAPEPSAGLAGRIAAEIAAERRSARRRRRFNFGLAIGTAAAAAAAAFVFLVLPGGSSEPSQRVDFASLPPGMQISAALEPRPFGTQIRMQVSGVRSGTLCRVFLRRADGARVAAGTFRYRYGGDSQAVLSSALDLSRAESIGVRAGDRTFLAPIAGSPVSGATERHEYKKEKT